jgi:hypothetical protein
MLTSRRYFRVPFLPGKISLANMERYGVGLTFQYGKRRKMTDKNAIRADEAQEALDTIEDMHTAGRKRAAPSSWYGIGISLIVAVGFALYAQKDPGSIPGLVIALGTALFVVSNRDKSGAVGKTIPDTRSGVWALAAVTVFLLTLFFGGIYVRRAFDLAWVPIATGLIAGVTLFLLSVSERRYYLGTADNGKQ